MSILETEQVLVIPTDLFRSLGYFQGFSRETDVYVQQLLGSDLIEYRPRSEMERDDSYKQLIPYCIFRHVNDAGETSVFCYTRGGGSGESRLKSKMSIGVGGHISSIDAEVPGADVYQRGLERELEEEISIETGFRQECVGLINDDETDVGRVHLGIVHLYDVDQPSILPRESGICDAGFVKLDELAARFERMESWSQICLRALFELQSGPKLRESALRESALRESALRE